MFGRPTDEDQDLVIDQKIGRVVQELTDDMSMPTRGIYDGLIRAARKLRRGRPLDDIG